MKKILIIPFHVSKKIADADYLSEGIVEELIDFISELGTLTVLGRNLSLFLKSNPKPGKELVNEFGVDYLIEGSVKKNGSDVSLSIRLINAANEQIIATRKSPIVLEDWTNQLGTLVVDLLKVEYPAVGSDERATNKKNVRELYLKGLYHWNRYTYEEMKIAIGLYKKVIKEDPEYYLAYAGLADCYSVIAVMGYGPIDSAFAKAFTYVNQAIALNDKHSDSYLAASYINMFYQKDYKKAKTNLDYALGLNRNNSKVHHRLSFYYGYVKEFDLSEQHCLIAIKLDPVSIPQYAMLIRLSLYKKDYHKALEVIESTLLIDGAALPIIELKGLTYLLLGNVESAISVFRKCLEISSENLFTYGLLAYALASSGFIDDSQKVEDELDSTTQIKSTGNYDYAKAIIKLARNDFDSFFYHLNKSLDLGLTSIIGEVYNNPIYSEIRKDERYQAFLERCNLGKESYLSTKIRRPISQLVIQSNTKERLVLDPQDIAFVKGEGNYCTIFRYEKDILICDTLRLTLKQLEFMFNGIEFLLRIHKSYLINLDEDLTLSGNAKGYFLESPYFPIRIPVSRSKSGFVKGKFSDQN